MAGKKVWVSWLPAKECEAQLQSSVHALQQVGLEVSGAPWEDDLEKCAWMELGDMLSAQDGPELFIIAGRVEDFAKHRFRYGLSLLCAFLLQHRPQLKVFRQVIDSSTLQDLPRLLHDLTPLDTSPGWSAKVVAAAYSAATKATEFDCHVSVIAHSAIGQWFEIGPKAGQAPWAGAMLGVSGNDAKVVFQAVGERGQLPDKAVNEYAMQGIKADIAEHEYEAWALKNAIADGQSYYVKVQGFPSKVMFAEHPDNQESEVTVITLS
jgi:hypothetical protein